MKKPVLINQSGQAVSSMSPAQRECVDLLRAMLNDAERGDIWSCVVVACGPNDFGSAMAGSDAPRMVLGLEVAKANIMARVTGGKTVIHK